MNSDAQVNEEVIWAQLVTSGDTDMVAMDTDAITMETAVKPETAVRMFCEHFNTGAYY